MDDEGYRLLDEHTHKAVVNNRKEYVCRLYDRGPLLRSVDSCAQQRKRETPTLNSKHMMLASASDRPLAQTQTASYLCPGRTLP